VAETVYSSRLFLGHALSATARAVLVPGDELWVIRTVSIFAPGGSVSQGFECVDSASGATTIWWSNVIDVAGFYDVLNDLRVVCEPGDVLLLSGLGNPDVGLYGYRFSVPI
jgi:hypothetical protein